MFAADSLIVRYFAHQLKPGMNLQAATSRCAVPFRASLVVDLPQRWVNLPILLIAAIH